ncbi:unnamed protein product [Orchesella dallaii]|uniref:UBC core domain-containing protein n=1 Tax=Orchesella dallaii TaxID=48710 RepID=A0ABP1RP72_9HEXA
MATMAANRLQREFNEAMRCEEVTQFGIRLRFVSDNWNELRGEIAGPPDTPYEGGVFALQIVVPDTYPFVPPKIHFLTKIWHPNISSVTGAICMNILQDEWAAVLTLRTVLISLQALLAAPEPDDPQDAVVARQCKNHPTIFKATAEHWTAIYAGGPNRNAEYENRVTQLVGLKVDEVTARAELSANNWSLELATESIFS